MKSILFKLLGRAGDLADVQPVLALFIGGAFLTVFLAALFHRKSAAEPEPKPNLVWIFYQTAARALWGVTLVGFLLASISLLRVYLHQAVANFQRNHGRITEANFNAIQTIWGTPQEQGELRFDLYYEEEVTDRIESEDVTKPAVLRKKIARHYITANPFITERHEVTLRQNARKKGSALYGGYETTCRFSWKLKNPSDRDLNSVLTFPLPSATGIYDDLTAELNGNDVLPQMQLKGGALSLAREVKDNEALEFVISFKSRGMSYWYFQVREPREIRDFALTVRLPDLAKPHLNFPEGCMTPTSIEPTPDSRGSVLAFQLDHAISAKGMGIALPSVAQPGATTTAVLGEIERGWLLIFAMLTFAFSRMSGSVAVLLSVGFGVACACGYGLLADFSDLLFGFWGTAALVLVPFWILLLMLLKRLKEKIPAKALAILLVVFGLVYPCAAGLDADRQSLYFDLCALLFLGFAGWDIIGRLDAGGDHGKLVVAATPA
ncbi:MAG TPA: hypothetical protein VL361_20910 [Candidatus Limnocylindrales bacterium]|jgi:hypothetical protein|nr:hypothetical protein [Candidatus Limnocylindrales bacterium]